MVDAGETDVSRAENTWKPGGSGSTVSVGTQECFTCPKRLLLIVREATQKHAFADVADSVPLQLWTRSPFRSLVRYIFSDTNVVHYDGAISSLRYYPPDILEVLGINLVKARESRNTRCSFDTFINQRSS